MATEGALCVEETAVSQDSDKSLLAPIFLDALASLERYMRVANFSRMQILRYLDFE